MTDDLLARYRLEAQKELDRAKEIKDRITKPVAKLVKLPRYEEKPIAQIGLISTRSLNI